ncbi:MULTISPECIES: hypothetical protein [Streptomyces]|jgi:uric acid transporter|uniref:Xanthine/uracil permease n=1 Tax=Streptomyces nymphaeiformis TaxID=2663842 RepID=A0A7W7XFY5_9ACTN|nr:xanthine/uracil permease [Streptomyces nymphaeiformis]
MPCMSPALAGCGDNVLMVAIPLGAGIIPTATPDSYRAFPESARIVPDSGISTSCVVAVLLSLAFNHLGRKSASETTSEPALHH